MQTFQVIAFAALFAFVAATSSGVPVPTSEFDCSRLPNVDYFYGVSGNCSVFYRCVPGYTEAYRYTCDPGQVFYEANQRCEYPYDIPSSDPCYQGDGSSSSTGTPSQTFDCTGLANGFYTTEDCTATYYNCDGTITHVNSLQCPNGLVFNDNAGYCDYPVNVPECGISTTTVSTNAQNTDFDCTNLAPGYYVPEACSGVYYYCNGVYQYGSPVTCPTNLVYNPAAGYCDYQSNVAGC